MLGTPTQFMLTISDLIIYSSENLRAALQRMTRNHRGVLFVCDQDGHLVGVLSDGDIRRSLLDDTLLVAPVEQIMNTDPITASTTEEASTLLRRRNLVAVPIVDSEGIIQEAVVEDHDTVLVLTRESSDPQSRAAVAVGTVALIPARGGSKRIPRKNLASVGGKSLLGWTIHAAKNSKLLSHVLVSTDDTEISEAARAVGVDVPWLRPAALSADTTPTLDVVVHALDWAVKNLHPKPEIAVLLEPTAPLRTGEQIDDAISLLMNSDADCVASVSELPHVFNPEEVLAIEDGSLRPYLPGRTMESRRLRNSQSSAYVLNGLVYAFRVQTVLDGYSIYGHKTIPLITPWENFLDIDTPEDLELANFKIERCNSHS